ncbi:hypothetical protein bsdtw1_03496 [Clostridium fungisolvens]|uniref:Uncharacterized protein n=1 Tax=Clostridium fungisolvens TaxID=1604897 RepID=A0A6V8SJH0_9CLOT|nr:hypothetical protein bsdtw1_03496 [Clostridium fungisolvens]
MNYFIIKLIFPSSPLRTQRSFEIGFGLKYFIFKKVLSIFLCFNIEYIEILMDDLLSLLHKDTVVYKEKYR